MNGYDETYETREDKRKWNKERHGANNGMLTIKFRPAKNFSCRFYNFLSRQENRRYVCVLKLKRKL
jgi:hypothetical protein